MQVATPVFSAGWIEWAGPIIVFILYTIGQLVMSQGKKPAQQRVPPKPRPAAPPPQPRTVEEKLRSEVEEFLRQVQGEPPKPAQTRPKTVGPAKPVVVKIEQPAATVIELEPERMTLQEHVARHISTADVVQHAVALGAEVGQADEKMVAHLQERFQHQLGALEPRQQQQPEVRRLRNATATEIANLLRSPTGVRQVIVASEILRRPEF